MVEEILLEIGLNRSEAEVYTTLLKIGSSSVTQIAKECKKHRTNVYDSLERLIEKGLVSYILKEETKHFEAADPQNLMNLLKEKQMQLKELLPRLLLEHQLAKTAKVHIYEGLPAAKLTLDNFLRHKKEILAFGTPKKVHERIGPFLANFHKRRVKEKIAMRHLYNFEANQRINHLNAMPLTEARSLPEDISSPVAITVCGDESVVKIWSENPLVILIESKDIADSLRSYFELLWASAKA